MFSIDQARSDINRTEKESHLSSSVSWNNSLSSIYFRNDFLVSFRLDFETFSIGQPNTQTVCQVDNFRVSGTTNKVPVICGQNVGQHSKIPTYKLVFVHIRERMTDFQLDSTTVYLIAPSSTADIQLIFSLGVGTATDRNWRIRIGLLPCSSSAILGTLTKN